ncbi:MAG TPA: thermonuclease family protein [Nevskiaceae bacterium]|nr:thermonuclease family protein [Nevskiaceae bacterium]
MKWYNLVSVDDIFLLLFLLSPVPLVISLIKPSIFSRYFKRDLSRKKLSLFFGGATVLFFVLFCLTIETTPREQVLQAENSKQESQTVAGESIEETHPSLVEQPTTSNVEVAIVTRVIDGDTIEIEGGQEVRYIGIDTPETVHPSNPVECYGKEASQKNKELVEGKEVKLEKDVSETDKYGRLLRYVWLGDMFVNEYLVKEGYAQSSSYPPDVRYQDRFLEAQRKAREEKKGLWGDICNPSQQIQTSPQVTPKTTPSAPTNATPPTQQSTNQTSESYTCDCSKTCPQMSSCAEAQYQLNVCGCTRRDGDEDGIACDADCQ